MLMAGELGMFSKGWGGLHHWTQQGSHFCFHICSWSAHQNRKLDVDQFSDLCENIGIYLLAGWGTLYPLKLQYEYSQAKKKWERNLAFLSHRWQRIAGSLFSSVKKITELLACSDFHGNLRFLVIHSLCSSYLCLWRVELTSLGVFYSLFLFLFSSILQELNMNTRAKRVVSNDSTQVKWLI